MKKGIFTTTAKILAFASLTALPACGTGGIDPIKLLTETSLPQLGQITSASLGGQVTQGFTPAAPYWTMTNLFAFAGTYLSAANGIVVEIGTTTLASAPSTPTNFITIMHSGRLSTRFYGLQQIVVRVGDTVTASQSIGTFFNNSGLIFQVLVDGNPVCPLSYMNDTFRANFTSWSTNPCQ